MSRIIIIVPIVTWKIYVSSISRALYILEKNTENRPWYYCIYNLRTGSGSRNCCDREKLLSYTSKFNDKEPHDLRICIPWPLLPAKKNSLVATFCFAFFSLFLFHRNNRALKKKNFYSTLSSYALFFYSIFVILFYLTYNNNKKWIFFVHKKVYLNLCTVF